MPGEPQEATLSAVKQAHDALMAFVRSAPAGTRLPPERDLAKRFGVSRTTLRSAVDRLALLGYLQVRHGSGTVTMRPGADRLGAAFSTALEDMPGSLKEVFAVRIVLEPSVAAQVAKRATPRSIRSLRAAAIGPDVDFHRTLAALADNAVAAQLLGVLIGLVPTGLQTPAGGAGTTVAGGRTPDPVARQHLAIAEAVADGDPELARASMRLHLKWEARRRADD